MADSINQSALDDLFLKALVEGYIANPRFVRRDWLAAEVDALLADRDCRFVLLTAEPGAGKSAFMAQLAKDNPEWPRYFIRRDQRDVLGDVGIHSFLLRIGYQLAARFPELFDQEQVKIAIKQRIGTVEGQGEVIGAEVKRIFASPFYTKVLQIQQQVEQNQGSIVGLRVEELVIDPRLIDQKDLQFMALIDPALALLKREPARQIVVLVDALDEIRYHGSEGSLLKWLIDCPELPGNVKFVLTSRPPEGEVVTFREKKHLLVKPLTINPEDDRVQVELKTYVEKLLTMPEVATILKETGRKSEKFTIDAVKKADGNIGYLDALARGIDQTLSMKETKGAEGLSLLKGLLSLKELPKDTQELYGFFLHQIKNSPAVRDRSIKVRDESTGKDHFLSMWTEVYKPLLGVLSVAFEPLSVDQIHALGGIVGSRDDVIEALEWLRQLLDQIGNQYRFYHSTVPDFLTDKNTHDCSETEDLFVESKEWHQKIANHYWKNYHINWNKCDDYGLRYLGIHLFDSAAMERPSSKAKKWIEMLYSVICKPLMQEKFTRFGSNSLFAEDIDLALMLVDLDTPINWMELVRCNYIYAKLGSFSSNIPSELLSMLAELNQVNRAIDFATLIQDKNQQYQYFLEIAKVLKAEDSEAGNVLTKAFIAATAILREEDRAIALSNVAINFAGFGQSGKAIEVARQALTVAESIGSEESKAKALSAVIPALALVKDWISFNRAMEELRSVWWREKYVAIALSLSAYFIILSDEKELDKSREFIMQALETTKRINSYESGDKAFVLDKIIETLSRIGDLTTLKSLTEAIQQIENMSAKAKVLSAMVYALICLGQKDDALAAIKVVEEISGKAPDVVNRLLILARLVWDLGEAKEINLAIKFADKILAEESSVENSFQRAQLLCQAAHALTKLEVKEMAEVLIEKALAATKIIQDSRNRSIVLSRVAKILSDGQKKDKALVVAKQALVQMIQINPLGVLLRNASLSKAFAEIGDKEKALSLVDLVLEGTINIKEEEIKTNILKQIIQTLSSVGHFERALAIANEIQDLKEKAKAHSGVALSLLKFGKREEALEIVNQILVSVNDLKIGSIYDAETDALINIISILGEIGSKKNLNRVKRLVQKILDNECRAKLMRKTALGYAQIGDTDTALLLANQIVSAVCLLNKDQDISIDDFVKAYMLSEAACAFVKVGSKDFARTVVNYVLSFSEGVGIDSCNKAQALENVAQVLTEVSIENDDVWFQTLASAEGIWDDRAKAAALSRIARSAIKVKNKKILDHILIAIEGIGDVAYRSDSLASVAVSLNKAGNQQQALNVLRNAFAEARLVSSSEVFFVFTKSVPVLEKIDQAHTLWDIFMALQDVDSWWE